jgi:hypothetical protein
LLGLLDRLVDSGKSIIVIEHHQAVMAHADWIIDLVPAPATTADRLSSKAHPPTLSQPAPPSPVGTSRPMSAAERAGSNSRNGRILRFQESLACSGRWYGCPRDTVQT